MNWLTQTFSQYSVAWLAISAVVGLLTGAASSWITYQFKKRETTEIVKAEINQERKKQALHQEKERGDRIRGEIIKWANPILGAVQDLEGRLDNILNNEGYLVLDENYAGRINPNWSITYEFFMQSALYLFAQYFAWVQMLVEELSFELFQSEQTKDEFFRAIHVAGSALGSFPHSSLEDCGGEDKQVFKLQQRAIGELLILRSNNMPHCMSYTDFLRKLAEDESFQYHLKPVRDLLEKVAPTPLHNCRWKRLAEMKEALSKLKNQCQQLLTLSEIDKQNTLAYNYPEY